MASKKGTTSKKKLAKKSARGSAAKKNKAPKNKPVTKKRAKSSSGLTEKQRDGLSREKFAFPKERKEPLNNASHVRNAIARFNQVKGVTDTQRDSAWKRIKAAAKRHKVDLSMGDWRELARGGKARK